MNKTKTKWRAFGVAFLSLSILWGVTALSAQAQTETTFPVDEAGISAYVKLDSADNLDIVAAGELMQTIVEQGESYVIGTVAVTNTPHLYIGLDGWLVAYFLNTEEASKIAGGTSDTTLQDAIDYMVGELGVTYSTDIKYYDFEFPEANKLTMITEQVGASNSFYVTVPGTLYEASYWVDAKEQRDGSVTFYLEVDEVIRHTESFNSAKVFYWHFDIDSYFQTGVTHYITSQCGGCYDSEISTVLVYKN